MQAGRTARQALRWLIILAASLGLAIGGIVLLLHFFGARDRANVDAQASGPGLLAPDRGDLQLAPGTGTGATTRGPLPTSGAHVATPLARDGAELDNDQILTALALGNVVLIYGSPRPPAPLRSLQEQIAGAPTDRALFDSGQAVVLGRRAGTAGVVALAWRRELRAATADDPALQTFADFWLGRGETASR